VSNLYIPITAAEAGTLGADLDGDGTIDNKLGTIMQLLISSGSTDPNPVLNADIAQGDLVVPLRVYLDAWSGDATTMVLAYEGVPLSTPPAFDGQDVVDVAPGSPTDAYLCGPYATGELDVGPGQLLIPIPLVSQTVFVPLQEARVIGPVSQTGWTNVIVAGGATPTDIDQIVLPAMLIYFNQVIGADPFGSLATTLMSLFDGACTDLGGACAGVVPGVGECADNQPTDPDPLTITELRCSSLLQSALAPDVDIDNDGTNDLLSIGLRLQAVRATINTP
jgi:hypothetical protein